MRLTHLFDFSFQADMVSKTISTVDSYAFDHGTVSGDGGGGGNGIGGTGPGDPWM